MSAGEFSVRRWAIGAGQRLNLDTKEKDALINAFDIVRSAVANEEEYEVTFKNFLALETYLADLTLKHSYVSPEEMTDYFDMSLEAGRHFMNLLSSAKRYIDRVISRVEKIAGSEISTDFKEFIRNRYDESFAYRLMNALRNYSQHREIPISGLSYNSRVTDVGSDDTLLEDCISININPVKLKADKKFKSSVASELPDDDSLDIRFLIRQFVEDLGVIQLECRELTSSEISSAVSLVDECLNRFVTENALDEPGPGIVVSRKIKEGEHPTKREEIVSYFPMNSIDYWKRLINRNTLRRSLSRRYISTIPKERRQK